GLSGASDEPKSTVAALIWAMPPPEPIDWEVICLPVACGESADQREMAGYTEGAPAPVASWAYAEEAGRAADRPSAAIEVLRMACMESLESMREESRCGRHSTTAR